MKPEQIEKAIRATRTRVSGKKLFKQFAIIDGLIEHLPPLMEKYKINTPLRTAHFIAQLAHESDGFCTFEEYASGRAYEGRKDLGNTQPGYGVKYKGRGPIQCTGYYNYKNYGDLLGIDLVNSPERASSYDVGSEIACLYWSKNNLNKLADQNKIKKITRKINGGYNGLADRKRRFLKAAKAICLTTERPHLLKLRSKGEDVKQVQQKLKALGYSVGLVDGAWGRQTDFAVRNFQDDEGLMVDGKILVGGNTWKALGLG